MRHSAVHGSSHLADGAATTIAVALTAPAKSTHRSPAKIFLVLQHGGEPAGHGWLKVAPEAGYKKTHLVATVGFCSFNAQPACASVKLEGVLDTSFKAFGLQTSEIAGSCRTHAQTRTYFVLQNSVGGINGRALAQVIHTA